MSDNLFPVIFRYEVALGDEVPGVCLPYWDSSLDNELDDPAESSLFSAELIGNGKGPVITGPFAGWRRPQYEANATIRPPPLIRNVGVDGQLYSRETIEQILSRNDHSEIIAPNSDPDNDIEVQHGGVHMFIGGDMEDLETAPFDPIFFMHHAFIDYIWELFRSKLKNQLHVDPSKNYPMDHTIEFHGREDMMSIGNLSCGEGYSDRLMENVEYELSPSCSKQRPTCNSRFLRCKPEDGRCVPITLHESPLPYDPIPGNPSPGPPSPRPVDPRPDPVNPRPFPENQRPDPVNPRPFPVNQRPDPVNPRPFPVNQRPNPVNPRPFPVNQRPDPVNPRPFPVNQRPDPFNPRPFPVNQRPDPVNPRPFPVNQRPDPFNPRPFPVNQRPDPVNPRPFPVNQRPNPVNPRPFPVNQRPDPVNPRPFPVNQRPNPVNPRPFPVNQRPNPVNPRPFPVNQRPDPVNPRPFPVNQRPDPVNPRPFPVNQRPDTVNPRPFPVNQRPNPVNPRPFPVNPRPIPTGPRPVMLTQPPADPCGHIERERHNVKPYQNTYCINGVCDINRWVYVPVKVVTVRPPGFHRYRSFPVIKGDLSTLNDIYNPRAFERTRRLIQGRMGKIPKAFAQCFDDAIGQIFVHSQGMNYDGVYKESAIVDQRMATTLSIAYIAVKDPGRRGLTRVLFRAADSCGRVCHTSCKNPTTGQFEPCSGVIELDSRPPRMYSKTYGDATLDIWNFGDGTGFPIFNDDKFFLTFYCDYQDHLPWVDPVLTSPVPEPIAIQPGPSMVNPLRVMQKQGKNLYVRVLVFVIPSVVVRGGGVCSLVWLVGWFLFLVVVFFLFRFTFFVCVLYCCVWVLGVFLGVLFVSFKINFMLMFLYCC